MNMQHQSLLTEVREVNPDGNRNGDFHLRNMALQFSLGFGAVLEAPCSCRLVFDTELLAK